MVRPNTALETDLTFTSRSEVLDSALILGQTLASSKIRTGFSIRKMFQGHLSELNIWDRELSQEEIDSMRRCQSFQQGNIITWNKQNLRIKNSGDNLKIENVPDMRQLCRRRQYFLFPKYVDLHTASDQCKTFGGHIATPANTEENVEVLRLVKTYPQCLGKYLLVIKFNYLVVSLSLSRQ